MVTTTTTTMAAQTPAVRTMGLPSTAKAARISKVTAAQKLTPAEEELLEKRLPSCDRHLENVSRTITPQDRVLLEEYVREEKKRYATSLPTRNRVGLTPDTLRGMYLLASATPDAPIV